VMGSRRISMRDSSAEPQRGSGIIPRKNGRAVHDILDHAQ
jgi:hypothetical protein